MRPALCPSRTRTYRFLLGLCALVWLLAWLFPAPSLAALLAWLLLVLAQDARRWWAGRA